jgi:hypothetical protein
VVQPWGEIAVAHVQVLVHALDAEFVEAYQEQASAVQCVIKIWNSALLRPGCSQSFLSVLYGKHWLDFTIAVQFATRSEKSCCQSKTKIYLLSQQKLDLI